VPATSVQTDPFWSNGSDPSNGVVPVTVEIMCYTVIRSLPRPRLRPSRPESAAAYRWAPDSVMEIITTVSKTNN
jgi:hypothetical protein